MDYDFVLLVGGLSILFLSVLLLGPGLGADAPVETPTATPGPGTSSVTPAESPPTTTMPGQTASPTFTPSPTPTPTASSTPTPSPTPTPTAAPVSSPTQTSAASPTPTQSSTPSPTPTEGWPRAEFWHECDSRTSANIYYRVEVLGTQKLTELYGSDTWESNFPRTFTVSGTATHERSLSIRGGRWIELYKGKNTKGDPFARYYLADDACRDQ